MRADKGGNLFCQFSRCFYAILNVPFLDGKALVPNIDLPNERDHLIENSSPLIHRHEGIVFFFANNRPGVNAVALQPYIIDFPIQPGNRFEKWNWLIATIVIVII